MDLQQENLANDTIQGFRENIEENLDDYPTLEEKY